jgi:hypothetical protein
MLKQPYLVGALDNRVPGGTFDPDELDEPSGTVAPT